MYDPFDRKITCSAVALVFGRMRQDGKVWKKIFDQTLDPLIRQHDLFKSVPFLYVGILYQYGIKNDLKLHYDRIGKKYGDLFVHLELDMEVLMWADKHNLDLLHDIFMIAALEALIQVGRKYKFPTTVFEEERAKYGDIPNTIEECLEYSRQRA